MSNLCVVFTQPSVINHKDGFPLLYVSTLPNSDGSFTHHTLVEVLRHEFTSNIDERSVSMIFKKNRTKNMQKSLTNSSKNFLNFNHKKILFLAGSFKYLGFKEN